MCSKKKGKHTSQHLNKKKASKLTALQLTKNYLSDAQKTSKFLLFSPEQKNLWIFVEHLDVFLPFSLGKNHRAALNLLDLGWK